MDEYLMYSESDILERVDEYSLYCHYLRFEPYLHKKYSSPIRLGDQDPSFSLFEKVYGFASNVFEYIWKDQAVNTHRPQNIFDLVRYIYSLPSNEHAQWKVCADFGLGGASPYENAPSLLELKTPLMMENINIRVKSHPFTKQELAYWNQYHVGSSLLKEYLVTAVDCYWMTETQLYPTYPKKLGFAYRIFDKYQIYQPFQEKKKKFRNNWTLACIPGFKQLRHTNLCIITKSFKDVLCLRSLGYDAISPRGENIMLPPECIEYVTKRYKRVVVLFDNDGKHKAGEYPFPSIEIPLEHNAKDITDFCAAKGWYESIALLKQLLWNLEQ